MSFDEVDGKKVLIISGHDFRSKRKASIHFIANELSKRGPTRVFSLGFSLFSLIKNDPRVPLWSRANRVERVDDVESYLWRTLLHPVNLRRRWLDAVEERWFQRYARNFPAQLRDWAASSEFVIIESGMGIVFFDELKRINPTAKIIYLASDDLNTIGCSGFLLKELQKYAKNFDGICIRSRNFIDEFTSRKNLYLVPQALDYDALDQPVSNPYRNGRNAITVGSMLFDSSVIQIAAESFPGINFFVIGAGNGARKLKGPNISVLDEMPFEQTIPYLKFADLGIAPYSGRGVAPYLADTSLKLLQYQYFGIPAICPDCVVGGREGRYGYHPGDPASIVAAVNAALAGGRFSSVRTGSWAEVAEGILHPERGLGD